jgi:hypothetical protein
LRVTAPETKSVLPGGPGVHDRRRLPDVTVVADAGMMSAANQKAIEAAGLSFILGMRIPDIPYAIAQRRRDYPAKRPLTGTYSPSYGQRGRPPSAGTRSSPASTGPTWPGALRGIDD